MSYDILTWYVLFTGSFGSNDGTSWNDASKGELGGYG